jgi:CII-binding regulator of phage lambda lysogenization HflD
MPRKSKKQRNAEQAVRQQNVREEAKARRRPSRDDLARVLLWQMIVAAQRREDARLALDKLSEAIVGDLERQGFDVRESEDVFEDLADRYSDGLFPFRPKWHLKSRPMVTQP